MTWPESFPGSPTVQRSLITQVRGELKGISGRTEVLLANLNEVTGSDNRKQIAEILQQVNSLVATQSPKIDKITDQVSLLTTDADSVIKKSAGAVRPGTTRTRRLPT